MSSLATETHPAQLATVINKLKGGDKTATSNGVTVRYRPVIRLVMKQYALAYALSVIQKHCFTCTGLSISPFNGVSKALVTLLNWLKQHTKDTVNFSDLQTLSLSCLISHLDGLPATDAGLDMSWLNIWRSIGLSVDIASVINRRRRQEDRWFAVADLFNYIPVDTPSTVLEMENSSTPVPCVSGFGIFDGHGGPEAAEHCSHLAPYLLCVGLRRQLYPVNKRKDSKFDICFTELLADVFHRLNQSVNEGRAGKVWSSGTTGTICLLVDDTVYTGWLGDSQCWLYYRNTSGGDSETGNTKQVDNRCASSSQTVRGTPCLTQSAVVTQPTDFPRALSVALTDRIHRPEFAPEFVSIMHNGGSVSVHLKSNQQMQEERTLVFSGYRRIPSVSSKIRETDLQSLGLSIPPLKSSDLTDCRVDAMSCVSRSIGDDDRIPSISALPSVTVHCLHSQPLCLVLATDGLWDSDGCSGPQLANVIHKWWCARKTSNGDQCFTGLSKCLSQLAIDNGASDNITCILVRLVRTPRRRQSNNLHSECTLCVKSRWPLGSRVTSTPDNLNSCPATRSPVTDPTKCKLKTSRSRTQSGVDVTQIASRSVRLSSPLRHL